MHSRVRRPSPALVISVIALFVALGGTGYAAVTITGKNVRNGSLTGSDIRNSSVTGADVKNRSLSPTDFKGSVTGKTGATGPHGPQGPRGPAGPAGSPVSRTVLFATIKADGNVVAPQSSAHVNGRRTGTADYHLGFDRDLRLCTYTATPSDTGAAPIGVQIGVRRDAVNDSGTGNGLNVTTADSAGAAKASGFNVIVACP